MEKALPISALAAVIFLLLNVGCQGPARLSEADRAAIRQADETYVKLMNAKDYKALAAMYAEDAIYMPPNEPAAQGRAAIQAVMEKNIPLISSFQLQLLEVDGRGDLAYTREMSSLTWSPIGEPPREIREKIMAVWRKQPDGSWKVLRDIWNSDLPLPAPEKPATTAKKGARGK